ncbi:flagellin domain protein [Gemmatirosa kalamazoonensis]|uniref:Flagellin n=1 Tax=Gemmatirosa kalamazoonensis TaxID=861299 RepID=W0RAB0_9BACT|nr:flagellin [Gemmatirosa kalamazoonensis]AHG87711.1 flagellin domain protein [Gemmatirosa kalamazoonensis]
MRITNALVTHGLISQLTGASARLTEAQERVTTGLRVQKMSDDPAAAATIMQTSSALRSLGQFRTNVQRASAEVTAEDSALGQLGDVLMRAKELAFAQQGVNANATTRAAAAAEVQQLIGQVVSIGNTKFGDSYIFGGMNSTNVAPFDASQTTQTPNYVAIPAGAATPRIPQGMRSMETESGQPMTGAHDGDTVFLQTGVLSSLQDLYAGLTANSGSAVTTSLGELDGAFNAVQALVGDVGARQNRLDAMAAHLDAYEQNLQGTKSSLSEVDMEEAITEMVARQTAYQAAMQASSRVMGLSLTDYLR